MGRGRLALFSIVFLCASADAHASWLERRPRIAGPDEHVPSCGTGLELLQLTLLGDLSEHASWIDGLEPTSAEGWRWTGYTRATLWLPTPSLHESRDSPRRPLVFVHERPASAGDPRSRSPTTLADHDRGLDTDLLPAGAPGLACSRRAGTVALTTVAMLLLGATPLLLRRRSRRAASRLV